MKNNEIKAVFEDDRNAAVINLLIKSGIKLIKSAAPENAEGKISFGFSDPYYTGITLGYLGMLRPLIANVDINPVFDKAEFQGNIMLSGKIRLYKVLFIFLKVWFNKDFRRSSIWEKIHQSEQ